MEFAQSITTEQIEKLPLADFTGEIEVIETEGEQFQKAIDYLTGQKVIGFDTETKPCFVAKAPKNRMAILQLSSEDKAFIFRLQMIGVPKSLAALLSNPAVIKVGAAVDRKSVV